MNGICYGVSVGPGNAGLITLEAVEIIKKADIIFLPSFPKDKCKAYIIAKKSIPDIDEKDIRCETFTMSRDSKVMKDRHEEIYQNIRPILISGKSIAFLTLGEVGLYSTYLYIHEKLLEGGYTSRLINGVSSVQAIAARLGIALANGNEELHIFPDTNNLEERLCMSGTKIFMKPKGDIKETISKMKHFSKEMPERIICGISNCGMENEIIATNADELERLEGYFTVFIAR